MIQLTSNVDNVLTQLKAFRSDVPAAVARALSWEKWIGRSTEVAESTLNALAGPEDQQHVRSFVEAIKGFSLQGVPGFALRLASPLPRVRQLLGEARTARGIGSSVDAMTSLFQGSIVELEKALLEWVETEKDKDERDYGKTDEEVSDLISYILISPNLGEAGVAARDGLMRHIVPWLQRREEELAGLPPETVDLWLRAVLAAWREMVRSDILLRLKAELKSRKFP